MFVTEPINPLCPSATLHPVLQNPAACGFPNPAADYLQEQLSLDSLLIDHPAATFFVRAQGQSMQGAGIFDGDLLIIDRALAAKDGNIVLVLLDGDLAVKRLHITDGGVGLYSENPDYPPVILSEGQQLDVWGVVIHVIHSLR